MSTVVATHSRLGASSAERWMNCPGSNVIIETLNIEKETDESSYAALGNAAHDAAAHCLREKCDAWEVIGMEFNKHKVDKEMADAIQMYLDVIAAIREEHGNGVGRLSLVEQRITGDFDDLFYGTVDSAEASPFFIDITDYKHGEGIAVDAYENAQLMYYAVGIIMKLNIKPGDGILVRLRIVQPRAFHADGPVRVYETTTDDLLRWRDEELVPAMQRARIDRDLLPGEHCRFCPSKLACPLLQGLFKAAVTADAGTAKHLTNEQLALEYQQIEGVKHFIRGIEREVMRRLELGENVSGGAKENTYKLVYGKANRVLTPEGEQAIKDGEVPFDVLDAYETKLKSPAQIEKISSKAKAWAKEFAYTPQNNLTVAPSTDKKPAVKVSTPKENFAEYV